MKLHPLINPDSPHYEAEGKTAIELFEEQLTVQEMIGFCKGNIFKYEYRAEHKGQKESDFKKIKTYKDYLELLESVYDSSPLTKNVKGAFDILEIKFRYK